MPMQARISRLGYASAIAEKMREQSEADGECPPHAAILAYPFSDLSAPSNQRDLSGGQRRGNERWSKGKSEGRRKGSEGDGRSERLDGKEQWLRWEGGR